MLYITRNIIPLFVIYLGLGLFQLAYSLPWQPTPGTSWQWQLSDTVDNEILDVDTSFDVEMYDIDLFDTPVATINTLHNDGRKVICYFSAGSYEDWRSDAGSFNSNLLGNALDGWEGERWLDIRNLALRSIMEARLDLAVEKNCDGVEPDNVDGYQNGSGFSLSAQDQLDYNKWLAQQAHQRGLSIGLKNDLDQINELVNDFDWALNEECFFYNECDLLEPFIAAGKAVFGVEYIGDPDVFCSDANTREFSWLKKTDELLAPVLANCLSYANNDVPQVASLLSPNGTITNNKPTYTWNAVSNSTWYYLWVNDSTGNVIKRWYTAEEAGCASGAGTCAISHTTQLAEGSVQWWVQTWNDIGSGPWSLAKTFLLESNAPVLPSVATLISPEGDISDTTPTYTWSAVPGSTWYYLWVNDSTGNAIKKWYSAGEANCASGVGICAVNHPVTLAVGNGQWWIQTWNSVGYGSWSTSNSFSLN